MLIVSERISRELGAVAPPPDIPTLLQMTERIAEESGRGTLEHLSVNQSDGTFDFIFFLTGTDEVEARLSAALIVEIVCLSLPGWRRTSG